MASNLGQLYEKKIRKLLRAKPVMPLLLERSLKTNDAGFMHGGVGYFVEVKNIDAPDYGQKGLIWQKSTRKWEWRKPDIVTELYDELGVKKYIKKGFVPRRHTVEPVHKITFADKVFDQKNFEDSGRPLKDLNLLYQFYARKNCHYIQVEGKGFYYLLRDIANLNVPRFVPLLSLRLRAKTHTKKVNYKYSFFAVIRAHTSALLPSPFDLEEKVGAFPPIS